MCGQVANAARTPQQTYIAAPAASWLDDFLSWISPEIPRCCRSFEDGTYCPPPDQPPCSVNASACTECTTCFRASGPPGPDLLSGGRPSLHQVARTPWLWQHHSPVPCELPPCNPPDIRKPLYNVKCSGTVAHLKLLKPWKVRYKAANQTCG